MANCNCDCTRTVLLRFRREELLYDIGNYSYVEGDLLGDEAQHAAHQVQDIVADGNVDRVTRILNLAHRECVELLYPYTKRPVEDQLVLDDVLERPSVYEITLTLPSTFGRSTVELLRDGVHEYMVCRVLQDWFSLANTPGAVAWEAKLESIKTKMRNALLSRARPLRRKQHPF